MPTPTIFVPLRTFTPADRSTHSAPRPSLLTTDGRYDVGAVMRLAHDLARDDVADAARRGRVHRYKIALRDALRSAWSTAQMQRWCAQRDAAAVALPCRSSSADYRNLLLLRIAACCETVLVRQRRLRFQRSHLSESVREVRLRNLCGVAAS